MSGVEMELTARLSKAEEAAKFSRQHLANSLWALATLERLPSGRLLIAVAEAMKERASDCNPQEISNTVWAFAKLGKPLLLFTAVCCCFAPPLFLLFASVACYCFVPKLYTKLKDAVVQYISADTCTLCWHLLASSVLAAVAALHCCFVPPHALASLVLAAVSALGMPSLVKLVLLLLCCLYITVVSAVCQSQLGWPYRPLTALFCLCITAHLWCWHA